MTRRLSVAVASGVFLVAIGLGLGSWYLDRDLGQMGMQAPDAAVAAAIDQYGHKMGLPHLQAQGATGWDDCAVINLADSATNKYYGPVLVTKEQGRWRLRASPDTGLSVDADDVAGSHDYCLDLARRAEKQG